jgi:hypothetical protein
MLDADKTDRERATVSLSPAVRDKLNEFIAALRQAEGRAATQDQLVGALLDGVPLWQADLMLRSYIKQAEDMQDADEDEQTG